MNTKNLLEHGFAFLSMPDGRVVVGMGPFRRESVRSPKRFSFYAPDFFLTDPEPWWIPHEVLELSVEDFLAFPDFSALSRPRMSFVGPSQQDFRLTFAEVMQMIFGGRLQKAVPVVVESGEVVSLEKNWPLWCTKHALVHASNLVAYGLVTADEGIIGATPELLFAQMNPYHFSTMALAGTKVAEDDAPLLQDEKILREHRVVVETLLRQLRDFGEPEVGQTRSVFSEHLEHLRTDLEMGLLEPVDILTWVNTLHPTPALGVFPREEGKNWLRRHLPPNLRKRFGAPFAACWPSGEVYCGVAIRNVQWQARALQIMAGCGVVAGSQCDTEWEELRLKRESTKRVLGL